MQMRATGNGQREKQMERAREGGRKEREGEKTIIAVMNEGGGRSPRAIAQSLRQASVALTSLS